MTIKEKTYEMLINRKTEITFLQETHSTPDASKKWKKEWLGKTIWHSGTTPKASGVAILFKEKHNSINTKGSRWPNSKLYHQI